MDVNLSAHTAPQALEDHLPAPATPVRRVKRILVLSDMERDLASGPVAYVRWHAGDVPKARDVEGEHPQPGEAEHVELPVLRVSRLARLREAADAEALGCRLRDVHVRVGHAAWFPAAREERVAQPPDRGDGIRALHRHTDVRRG